MNITNNGTDTFPVPLTTGGYDEVGPGESKDIQNVDVKHATIVGQRHIGRIFVSEDGEAAQAETGTASSALNEPTPDRSTSRKGFKALGDTTAPTE